MASAVHTFLFTDVEGSTRAWQDDSVWMSQARESHDETLLRWITEHGGRVFKHTGDGVCAVFEHPSAAVAAAVDAQPELDGLGLRVRMGIHAGPAETAGDDYFGLTLNRCARIMSAAHGGQVLMSLVAQQLCRDDLPKGVRLVEYGEHHLRDLTQPEVLYGATGPGLRSDFPPARSERIGSADLPPARTALVGRADALVEVLDLIGQRRLVSIVGPGGGGKTALALEAAREAQQSGEHAVVFVDLTRVTEPQLVADAVGSALGLSPPSGAADVADRVGGRKVLLVLDNCEHVIDACADLVDRLLDRCGSARLLVTSREPVGVDGERIWRIPSLELPAARLLFIERARAAGATDMPVQTVDAICRGLDGLPLAIELIAGQAGHLPMEQLRETLDGHFLDVSSGRRGRHGHQTVAAALDLSYERLDQSSQSALASLAVFVGDFSLSDAAAVALPPGSEADIRQLLPTLVDKSLVVLVGQSGRYRLLEPVRQYAHRRLEARGEAIATHERHRQWLLTWLPDAFRWDSLEDFERIETRLDNVRAALVHLAKHGHTGAAVRLAARAGPLFCVAGRMTEALQWLHSAAQDDTELSLDDRLAWRTAGALCALLTMRIDDATRWASEGRAMAPAGHPAVPPLLLIESWYLGWAGRSDQAYERLDELRRIAPDDAAWQANADHFHGIAALHAGDFELAYGMFRRADDAHAGFAPGTAIAFCTVALHLLERHDEAATTIASVDSDARLRFQAFLSDLTVPYARLLVAIGQRDTEAARDHLRHLTAIVRQQYAHLPSAWGFVVQGAGVLASATDRHELAVSLLAGSRAHRLNARFEGGHITGKLAYRRSQAALEPERAVVAREQGRNLSMETLIELAMSLG